MIIYFHFFCQWTRLSSSKTWNISVNFSSRAHRCVLVLFCVYVFWLNLKTKPSIERNIVETTKSVNKQKLKTKKKTSSKTVWTFGLETFYIDVSRRQTNINTVIITDWQTCRKLRWQTKIQTNRRTNIQTNKQMNKQTDGQTKSQTNKQPNKPTGKNNQTNKQI